MEPISLLIALDIRKSLPAVFEVARDCILKETLVLAKKQIITVLDRRNAYFIVGSDWNNKKFRLPTDSIRQKYVDTLDEYYPRSFEDLLSMVKLTDFIQVKADLDFANGSKVKKYTKIKLVKFLDNSDNSKVVLEQEDKKKIITDTEKLFNNDHFVFVKVKGTILGSKLLTSWKPQAVHFHASNEGICLPLGNVQLREYTMLDVMNIVSIHQNTQNSGSHLLYEVFPVDKRILVNLIDNVVPKQVENFGLFHSDIYQDYLMNVNLSIQFLIYAPRYYGSLKVEIRISGNEDKGVSFANDHIPSDIPTPRKSRSVNLGFIQMNSLRKSIRNLTRSFSISDVRTTTMDNDVFTPSIPEENITGKFYVSLDDYDMESTLQENESAESNCELAGSNNNGKVSSLENHSVHDDANSISSANKSLSLQLLGEKKGSKNPSYNQTPKSIGSHNIPLFVDKLSETENKTFDEIHSKRIKQKDISWTTDSISLPFNVVYESSGHPAPLYDILPVRRVEPNIECIAGIKSDLRDTTKEESVMISNAIERQVSNSSSEESVYEDMHGKYEKTELVQVEEKVAKLNDDSKPTKADEEIEATQDYEEMSIARVGEEIETAIVYEKMNLPQVDGRMEAHKIYEEMQLDQVDGNTEDVTVYEEMSLAKINGNMERAITYENMSVPQVDGKMVAKDTKPVENR